MSLKYFIVCYYSGGPTIEPPTTCGGRISPFPRRNAREKFYFLLLDSLDGANVLCRWRRRSPSWCAVHSAGGSLKHYSKLSRYRYGPLQEFGCLTLRSSGRIALRRLHLRRLYSSMGGRQAFCCDSSAGSFEAGRWSGW